MPTGVYQRKAKAKAAPQPRVKAEKPKPEMFAVQITVPDTMLGQLLRCSSSLKGASVTGILPIEEHDPAKNLPRHSFKDALIEIIRKAGGSADIHDVKAKLFDMGFSKQRGHSGIGDAVRTEGLRRKGDMLSLSGWK